MKTKREIAEILWRFHNDRLSNPNLKEMKPYIEQLDQVYKQELEEINNDSVYSCYDENCWENLDEERQRGISEHHAEVKRKLNNGNKE